ncbi:MAG: phosphatidylserine decarboxylase [Candidatus Coatesbacteria bacterium]|nr:MAG: phosphatidylserine decarboxylase [Candidatus Coatesbacteria bacterium]
MLERSLAEAAKANPDVKTNPVQSLSDFYDFVDRASECLPQDLLEVFPNLSEHEQMLQGICYPYFLVNQPLPELENKGLFKNALQYYGPFSAWMRDFAIARGAYADSEESWSEEIYQEIYNDPNFGLQQGWYESPENWKTFNQFFAKYLKSPEVRPITSPDDASVVTSPADSVPQGIWPIDGDSKIQVDGGLKVKLATYYSVSDLLGEDSAYKDAFANGVLTHTFLNVFDYHRYHFAVGGTILEKKSIAENVALDVAWDEGRGEYIPLDSTGWQFTQTRGYVIMDTGEYGLVALMPMGMAQVSSVNFEDDVVVGAVHKKGDMLGNFLFGGSDFIMLFQEGAAFELTAPMENETDYKHLLVGEEYGRMTGAE